MIGAIPISKREFYANGGFANPNQYRKMVGKVWAYYYLCGWRI